MIKQFSHLKQVDNKAVLTSVKVDCKSQTDQRSFRLAFLFCVIAQNISKRAMPERVLKPSARAFGERKIHSAFA